ncbi:MAG: FxLYD domain-containing protein, partial [Desulfofundulus sp.]
LTGAVGVALAPAGEVAGLCPVAPFVRALGGCVEEVAGGRLAAVLAAGELTLVRGRRLAVYGGEERVLASAPVQGADGLYLAPEELANLLNLRVQLHGEEALFLVPSLGEELRLVEARTYADGPAWYLVGRVRNQGPLAQELVRISWEVGNAAGEVVASAAGYINFLNPGEVKAFKLVLPLRADAAWYRLKVTAGFPGNPRELHLTADAERYYDRPAAYLSLKGRVRNDGETAYDFLKVLVEFYNGAGELVDVDSVFLAYLDPGSSRVFTAYTPRLEEAMSWEIKFD